MFILLYSLAALHGLQYLKTVIRASSHDSASVIWNPRKDTTAGRAVTAPWFTENVFKVLQHMQDRQHLTYLEFSYTPFIRKVSKRLLSRA